MTGQNQGSDRSAVAEPPEAELVARLRAGDPLACEEFVRSQMGRALAAARRFLRDEADALDAVQDAFVSFFRSLGDFKQESRLSTWFHRIVLNAALMKRRAKARRPECRIEDLLPRFQPDGHRLDPLPAWEGSVEELVQSEELRRLVREKIDLLPEDYRNVVLLRDIEQLDTAEAASALGDTPGAVKVRLHRARQALRTLLERDLLAWNKS